MIRLYPAPSAPIRIQTPHIKLSNEYITALGTNKGRLCEDPTPDGHGCPSYGVFCAQTVGHPEASGLPDREISPKFEFSHSLKGFASTISGIHRLYLIRRNPFNPCHPWSISFSSFLICGLLRYELTRTNNFI